MILTEDIIKEFERYLRQGNYAYHVCGFLGVSRGSFYTWLRQGKKIKAIQNKQKIEITENQKLYLNFLNTIQNKQIRNLTTK